MSRTACALLERDPADVVMVGDDRHADAGVAALGCAVRFVDHLPVADRPGGLRAPALVADTQGEAPRTDSDAWEGCERCPYGPMGRIVGPAS